MAVTLNVQDLVGIPIVGVVVTTVMQLIKKNLQPLAARLAVIGLCIAVGTSYVLAANASWFPVVLGALGAASAIWAIIVKPFES